MTYHPRLGTVVGILLIGFFVSGCCGMRLNHNCRSRHATEDSTTSAQDVIAGRSGWTSISHEFDGVRRKVYVREGPPGSPPLIVLHELPGFSPAFIALCDRLARDGFTVYAPLYFGRAGQSSRILLPLRVVLSPRWAVRRPDVTRPDLQWTRSLVPVVAARHPGQSVGAVGNCLTGGFPLGLLTEPQVVAAVLSQPSLPFNCNPALAGDLGVSCEDWKAIQQRIVSQRIPVLAFRFEHDSISPKERFDVLEGHLGRDLFKDRTIQGDEYDRCTPEHAHAVLTACYVPGDANDPTRRRYEDMVAYLRERLR